MHHILRSTLLITALAFSLKTAMAQPALVACDLIDLKSAETILSHPIKQHKPNRSTQPMDGATVSDCIFFGDAGRNLRVTLVEYRSPAAARQAYTAGLQPNGFATHNSISNLGDAAAEWYAGGEGSGYKVLKGARVLMFDARGPGGDRTKGSLQRMRPFVVTAVKSM